MPAGDERAGGGACARPWERARGRGGGRGPRAAPHRARCSCRDTPSRARGRVGRHRQTRERGPRRLVAAEICVRAPRCCRPSCARATRAARLGCVPKGYARRVRCGRVWIRAHEMRALACAQLGRAPPRPRPCARQVAVRAFSAAAAAPGAFKATLFPGDGIGPEIARAVQKIFEVRGRAPARRPLPALARRARPARPRRPSARPRRVRSARSLGAFARPAPGLLCAPSRRAVTFGRRPPPRPAHAHTHTH